MSPTQEAAMKMALEALERNTSQDMSVVQGNALARHALRAALAELQTADDLREPKNGAKWRVEWWNESCRMMLPEDRKLDSFVSYKNGTLQTTIKRTPTTTLREAAQQALEALEFIEAYLATEQKAKSEAITALKAALAEPAPAPVAWRFKTDAWFDGNVWHDAYEVTTDKSVAEWRGRGCVTPLYTSPPQRPAEPTV